MAGSKSPLIDKALESAKNMTKNVVSRAASNAGSAPQNYAIDYDDPRFAQVDAEESAALAQSNAQYDQMIGQTDSVYQGLIDATNKYGETQAKNQQDRTDFAIEQIKQQKDQAQKDYEKEQRAAYADWKKQSDPYGVAAEQMAAAGLRNTGYSESSQVRMYTAYQNRAAVARETFNKAVLNYDNAIKDAQLSNNSALAEIAFNTLQTTLTLGIEKFRYKNELMDQKLGAQREIDNIYYNRGQDVLAQQNTENALAEQIRQFNANYEMSQRQHADDMAYRNASLAQDQKQFDATMAYNKGRDNIADEQWLKEFNESKRQYNKSLAEDKRQFNQTQKKVNSSSGGTSGGSAVINKDTDGRKVSNNQKVETQQKSGAGPKTAYEAFQTNIANMMVKGYSETAITNMENQLTKAVKNKEITEAQYKKLLDLLY